MFAPNIFLLQVKSGDEYILLNLSSNCESEGKDSDPNGLCS